jgi:hypothetical protein
VGDTTDLKVKDPDGKLTKTYRTVDTSVEIGYVIFTAGNNSACGLGGGGVGDLSVTSTEQSVYDQFYSVLQGLHQEIWK